LTLCGINDHYLKLLNDQSATQTPRAFSIAEILKKMRQKYQKKKLIETNKRNTRPTIIIKPKEGENIRHARMRLSKTINIQDRINFQTIQAKTSLILQMATPADEEKIRQHQGMKQQFDLINRSTKRNPLMIAYNIPSELKEKDVIEELIDRYLYELTDEQKQPIKPRF